MTRAYPKKITRIHFAFTAFSKFTKQLLSKFEL